jgi:hypothetical protein
MAAVISRAVADLKAIKASDHVRDEAMAWINSPECEAYCDAIDAGYRTIREQAAALYRRFLERAENIPRGKAPGSPGNVRGNSISSLSGSPRGGTAWRL